jgi:hypothetical protein
MTYGKIVGMKRKEAAVKTASDSKVFVPARAATNGASVAPLR